MLKKMWRLFLEWRLGVWRKRKESRRCRNLLNPPSLSVIGQTRRNWEESFPSLKEHGWAKEEDRFLKHLRQLRERCKGAKEKSTKIVKRKQKRKRSKLNNGMTDIDNDCLFKELVFYLKYLQFVCWKDLETEGNRDSVCRLRSQ